MRMKRQEAEAALIPVREVIAMNTAIAATVRTRMLGIGSKVAPRLVGIRTAGEVETIVSSEIAAIRFGRQAGHVASAVPIYLNESLHCSFLL